MVIDSMESKITAFLVNVSPYSQVKFEGEESSCLNYKAVNLSDTPVEVSIAFPDESSPEYSVFERRSADELWYQVYSITQEELEEES